MFFLVAPFFCGAFITALFRAKEATVLEKYVAGFLFAMLYLLASVLAALKLNKNLDGLSKIYVLPLTALAVVGLLVDIFWTVRKKTNLLKSKANKEATKTSLSFAQTLKSNYGYLWFLIPAALIGSYCILGLEPSFANDDTWEVVATTIKSGTLFEYSSMTGKLSTAGYPIFYKVYVIPMLYAILQHTFGLEMWLTGGILLPIVIYICNLAIVSKMAPKERKTKFMLVYLFVLYAGTYLPECGIPMTIGFPVLRQGYSGYAIAYGIAIPFALYLLMQKKYFFAVAALVPIAGLVRIDRIFFCVVKTPMKALRDLNGAGKLAGVYLFAAAVLIYIAVYQKKKFDWRHFLIPSIGMAYGITEISKLIEGTKKKRIYYFGVAIIIWATNNFRILYDATPSENIKKTDLALEETLSSLESQYGEVVLWSNQETMSKARRISGTVKTFYGRDDADVTMAGLDYEPEFTDVREYRNFMTNVCTNTPFLTVYASEEEMKGALAAEGVNLVLIPFEGNTQTVEKLLEEYERIETPSGYAYLLAN